MQKNNPFILCIDDDADDLMLLVEAFVASGCPYAIKVATDGEDALRQLGEMRLEEALPCLIVLDINMPRVSGRETIVALQADKGLKSIPVVAYSTSSSITDKTFFSNYNVAFFTKPSYFNELESVAANMLHHCRPQHIGAPAA
jgi:CheY-like chemotaxis protein